MNFIVSPSVSNKKIIYQITKEFNLDIILFVSKNDLYADIIW